MSVIHNNALSLGQKLLSAANTTKKREKKAKTGQFIDPQTKPGPGNSINVRTTLRTSYDGWHNAVYYCRSRCRLKQQFRHATQSRQRGKIGRCSEEKILYSIFMIVSQDHTIIRNAVFTSDHEPTQQTQKETPTFLIKWHGLPHGKYINKISLRLP